jgi:hypothetical protein
MNKDLLSSVIERWRSASMSQRMSDYDDDGGSTLDAPALQPQMPAQTPVYQPPLQPAPAAAMQASALRSSLLKKPLDASLGSNPPNMPRFNR